MRVTRFLSKPGLLKTFTLLAATALLAGAPRAAAAENWPTRPVTLTIAFAPGSSIDFVGRAVAEGVKAALGQPMVVETKQGGGGVVATLSVARERPDGYTLLLNGVGPAALRPLIDKSVGYDTYTDLTPISLLSEVPNVLLANPKLGLKTVKDLVAYAKKKGGKISIGHSGSGTMGHLATVLFASEAKLDVTSVSYRGTAPMMVDVLGGTIDAGFPAYNPATRQATLLAVASAERVDFLPDVPTMKESGYDLVGSTWISIFGPAHMPPEVVSKLNRAIDAFLQKPETKQRFAKVGVHVLGGPPERLTERIKQDRARWTKIIEGLNLGGAK
jgi:tripartite-type tricarboxylate transporter receptor subunit TctC